MKQRISIFILAFIVFLVGYSCKKEIIQPPVTDKLDTAVYNPVTYQLKIPPNFPYVILNDKNPLTVAGVKLGRMLYYDKLLSPDNSLSCSSCHLQSQAFSSPGNIIQHQNLAWSKFFLWNGGVEGTLEDAMEFEVNDFFKTDVSNLLNNPDYPYYFFKAFGTPAISKQKIAFALAQFIRTQISGNSRFDNYIQTFTGFTEEEEIGFEIFFSERGDCFHCHGEMLFTDQLFHNTGLDSVFIGTNKGRFNVTGNNFDIGKFKTPSLRNVEHTAPYMHDGRFQTLEEVIDFYNSPAISSATLDPIMSKPNHVTGLGLNYLEKADLIAFLKTLTDRSFLENPELSNPD